MNILIKIEIGSKENHLEILKKILYCIEDSFLPKPEILWVSDKDEKKISSFIDSIIFKEIENWKKNSHIQIFNNLDDTSFFYSINKDDHKGGFVITTQDENIIQKDLIKFLFYDFLKICEPIYGKITFLQSSQDMYRKYYIKHRRKGYSSGLCWLQYFAGGELKNQGSIEEIEQNPYIKTESINDGILVQVGESIYDSLTPEGEALLVKATEAMPPEGWDYSKIN